MKISTRSQLGLRLSDPHTIRDLLKCSIESLEYNVKLHDVLLDKAQKAEDQRNDIMEDEAQELLEELTNKVESDKVRKKVMNIGGSNPFEVSVDKKTNGLNIPNILEDGDGSFFLITEGVKHPSKMISISNFSARALKDIKEGKYTYLLGKSSCTRFIRTGDIIMGIYVDLESKVSMYFGFDVEEGGHYFDGPPSYSKYFTDITRIMTFVELGDIEVVVLEAGRNNGKPRDKGKVVNDSRNTVYVVDSSWNQLIIRTEGFAVRGHFRMQACGQGLRDRKLIWVDAFKKNGYIRRPKAEIIQ